jgi:hypothetical protein
MPTHDSDSDGAKLTFDPVAWEPEESESGVLRLLNESQLRLLRRLAAGENLFLLLRPGGSPHYDFGPDDPVAAELVAPLISLRTIEFHGAPGALVAMRARLTALGEALTNRSS